MCTSCTHTVCQVCTVNHHPWIVDFWPSATLGNSKSWFKPSQATCAWWSFILHQLWRWLPEFWAVTPRKNIIDPIKPYSAFISWYRIVSGFQWNKTCYSVETCLIPIPPPPILAASNFDPFFFLDTSRHDLGSPKMWMPWKEVQVVKTTAVSTEHARTLPRTL